MTSQRTRSVLALATLLVCLIPATGQAAITPYLQNFELLDQTAADALSADGWVVYGNVFNGTTGAFIYGYGAFPAPNDGSGFCQIVLFEGGDEQGFQQLVVYSDYNNLDHANGNLIESNVYHEMTVAAEDVGTYWKFDFQAKLGNLVAPSTALAFIKTLNPAAGYATTNFITVDMTTIPTTWGAYSLGIAIDASLVGQLLQFGFSNTATLYESSGVFYDNLNFYASSPPSSVPDGAIVGAATLGQNYPNPFNPTTRIDFNLERTGMASVSVYDVAGRLVATLHEGELAAGDHHVTWNGRTDSGAAAPTGLYNYVLRTEAGQVARSMTLVK